jgi:hypothetical protein
VATSPHDALDQLRREAGDGTLADLCRELGIELLVAFGSAVNLAWPAPPHDLDLAVLMTGRNNILTVLHGLVLHLHFGEIDLLDLARAGDVARAEALGRGQLLYEETPDTFAERQLFAVLQTMDTQWLRTIELEVLAR